MELWVIPSANRAAARSTLPQSNDRKRVATPEAAPMGSNPSRFLPPGAADAPEVQYLRHLWSAGATLKRTDPAAYRRRGYPGVLDRAGIRLAFGGEP